jgi:5-enolpyruvylshikimate-3-phosphate synthase
MAFAVLGTVPGAKVRVDDMSCAAVSFPGFPEMLKHILHRHSASLPTGSRPTSRQ